MALTSYKNPSTVTVAGPIAQAPSTQVVPRGQIFNPTGASSQVVPFQRPFLGPTPPLQSIPLGPSEIVPFQRPGVPPVSPPISPTPQPIQFPQQPLRAPNIPAPRPNLIQQIGQSAANQVGKNPLNQTIQGLRQGQSVGQALQQGARQTLLGKMTAKLAAAKAKLAAAGKVAAPAAGTLGRVAGAANKAALVVTAAQTGWEIGKFLEPIVVEALQGNDSNQAEEASIQALAEAIAKLEAAEEKAKQREGTGQQPIGDPIPPFVPTEPWSPPVPEPPIELPPLDPGQDIGLDLPPIERPGPLKTPDVPIDPIENPDLVTGKGGVNLNTPIWQKISAIEKKLDNLQFPEQDWSSILAPVLDKLDLITVAIPTIIDGITTVIEAPPNIEIPQPDLTPILTAIQTGLSVVPPATIVAISALIAPVIQGLTAISAQIAGQKLSTAVLLPQATNLAVAIPHAYQMATMIPTALQQAIAIPQATSLAVAVPQATNLAVALPQMQTLTVNDTVNSTKLDLINQLNIDQITALQAASEEAINQANRIKNLTLQAKQCCDLLDKKLRDIENEQKNIKNNLKTEFDKNEQRFPQITRQGKVKCKDGEPETDYNFGGHTLQALQRHLDLMLELQKLLVHKLCNFEIGGDIDGLIQLDCDGESGEIIPYQGKGIIGLANQLTASLTVQKRIWEKVCKEQPEVTGVLDLTCEGDEQPTLIPYTGRGITGLASQSSAILEAQKRIWQKVCSQVDIIGFLDITCGTDVPDEDRERIPYGGKGISGLSSQLLASLELQKLMWQKLCHESEITGFVDATCLTSSDAIVETIPFTGKGSQGLSNQIAASTELLKKVWQKVCSEVDVIGAIDVTCSADVPEEDREMIPYSGKGIIGLSNQLLASLQLQEKMWKKICASDELLIAGRHDLACVDDPQIPPFIEYAGQGLYGIHQQLLAMMLMQQKLLKESCERNEPIIIKSHYETHLEEFPITKSLELTFGEEYPTQKGSLWQVTIPYPKGEFLEEEGALSAYSLWNWDDDFEPLERRHGSAYCRLDLAGSNRFMAVYAESRDIGKNWLRMLYDKFVDSNIAPPSRLDDDGLPFVRITPDKKPKHNPIVRTTRCVRAVVTDFDENNNPVKCAAWYPPRS